MATSILGLEKYHMPVEMCDLRKRNSPLWSLFSATRGWETNTKSPGKYFLDLKYWD